MNRFDEIKSDFGQRSKSLLVTVADIMDSLTEKNLKVAGDFAHFAAAQVRLPAQVDSFGDYRDRSKAAYSKFGTALKSRGQELYAVVREVPEQIATAWTVEAQPVKKTRARKTTKRKSTAKKTAAKKTTAKKTAAK